MTHPALARLAAAVGALLLLVGLAAPAAAAPAPARKALPAAAPAFPIPKPDWWGLAKCGSTLIPNTPKDGKSILECAKLAIKGGKKTVETTGQVAGMAAKKVADSILGDAANAMADWTRDFLRTTFTWWLTTDSVQVKDSGVLGDPNDPNKRLSLHALMVGIGAGIATLLVMFQGIRMIIQRKGTPLLTVIQGLAMNVIVAAAGVGVIDALLVASDQLTKTIFSVAFGDDDVSGRMVAIMLPAFGNPMGLLMVSLICLLVGGIQVVLLFLRQAAIPIQALMLPIAGAGQVGGKTAQQWLPRLYTAIFTIIAYKPMAGLIIAVGFVEMKNGNGMIDFLRGTTTVVLSVISLRSLMAIFTPLGLTVAGAVSAGGGFAGALSMASAAVVTQQSGGSGGSGGEGGGTSAASHASHMDRTGPASGGDSSSEGSAAIQHASTVPAQGSAAEAEAGAAADGAAAGAASAASAGQAAGGASSAAAGSASGAATGAAAAAGGPVTIALVAAESGHSAIKKAADITGGKE